MAFDLTKFALWAGLAIAGAVVTVWVPDAYNWTLSQFHSTPTIKIDFQATNGCTGGNLIDLKRHFDNQSVRLEWGADRVVICDPDDLQTNAVNIAGDIARKFPGCLDYLSDSLRLMRASAAVCSMGSRNIFICDGEAGSVSPGLSALGSQLVPVPECSAATLQKFGFN
ncbi:hypothetical protein [Neorhizobium galegae]|uniref:hypothetical protein n=1 Tax=Neorhizobium galegae TaxID=399 RepID=UPI0021043D05|nr:hypothetical protein [Neorhizobium galegae]MCQ1839093.1 hypothetical protein [Neorhizobium galegae]